MEKVSDIDIKQLVAEMKNLREELARIKTDVTTLKKSLESDKHRVFFIKYRRWVPPGGSIDVDE
jgi:hypothetical protein